MEYPMEYLMESYRIIHDILCNILWDPMEYPVNILWNPMQYREEYPMEPPMTSYGSYGVSCGISYGILCNILKNILWNHP
jgi:hypothetical protein